MHISRTDRAPGVPPYAPAAAVIVTELGKLVVSLLLAYRETRSTLVAERDAGAREQLLTRILPGASASEDAREGEEEKQSLLLSKEEQERELQDASSSTSVATPSSAARPYTAEILKRIREDTFGPGWTQLSVPALLFTCQVRKHQPALGADRRNAADLISPIIHTHLHLEQSRLLRKRKSVGPRLPDHVSAQGG